MLRHYSNGMFSHQTLQSNSRGRSSLYRTQSNTCLDGVVKLIMAHPVSDNLCATDVARADLGSSRLRQKNESKFKPRVLWMERTG